MSEQERITGQPISITGGVPDAPEQWTFSENYKWTDTEPGETASRIRRMRVFPVKKKYREKVLKDAVQATIDDLQNYLQPYLSITSSKRYIRIHEVPLLIFPAQKLKIFMEDYSRVELTAHTSYRNWGYNHGLPDNDLTDEQLNSFLNKSPSLKELKGIPGIPYNAWRLCTKEEARAVFQNSGPGGQSGTSVTPEGVTIGNGGRPTEYYHIPKNTFRKYNNNDRHFVMDIYVADTPNDCTLLEFLLRQKWTPQTAINSPKWKLLTELYDQDMIRIAEETETVLFPTEKLFRAVQEGSIPTLSGVDCLAGSEKLFEEAKKAVLSCDRERAAIIEYAPMQLENPNGGSWELWDPPMDDSIMMSLPSSVAVYARDPRLDVQQGGVIGIDFGTKSTVVARQGDSDHIHLVRVGQGYYKQEVREGDYENPTVMEFWNLQRFLEAYCRRSGRPDTLWADLMVSQTAFEDWKQAKDSNLYFSFFSELKQWTGSQGRNIRIRDRNGTTELDLQPYLDLPEGAFDPVELYAYYIGLYINNMFTSQIYLEYLLSFPVTYSQAVREKILESFRRGLAKSLPEAVLNDPEYAEQFSVEQGAGEPAAYAVCALQEYGFRPAEGENIYYAIFDFGGGTTDFDFGLWRRATKDKKEKNYRYVINHFGDGGDQYLGGENLLELLAYRVFRDNLDLLRQEEITFSLPPRQELFDGHEFVIADSQEAHTNMRRMMEELRPLWERHEGYASRYTDGILRVPLVNRAGQTIEGMQIRVDTDKLEAILRQRIAEGVEKFLNALRTVFGRELFQNQDANHVHIFLAGNASKSDILQETFRERINSFTEEIRGVYRERGEDQEDREFFTLYPPLGTEDAKAVMRERGCCPDEEEEITRPTGKTGVAFGLIQCRSGSKIKVLSETRMGEEIKFRYWVGDDMDEFFSPVLTRSTDKGKWIEYRSAETKVFEFYYTTNPTAERPNVLPIKHESVSKWRLSKPLPASAVNEDWSIYLRTIGPDRLQFAVAADQEDADQERYQYGPVDILLEQ